MEQREDAMLVFDLEAVLDTLEPIEKNYMDFLDHSNSFLGWLLTLSDEEFEYVDRNAHHDYARDPEGGTVFLFKQIEMYKKDEYMVLHSELERDIYVKKGFTTLISLVRKGLASYKVADDDMEWEFETTDKGREFVENQMIRNLLEGDGKETDD